jgi:hypothetical protein
MSKVSKAARKEPNFGSGILLGGPKDGITFIIRSELTQIVQGYRRTNDFDEDGNRIYHFIADHLKQGHEI